MPLLKKREKFTSTSDLSKKSVVVYDRGLFLPFALKLGQVFGNVYYYLAEEKANPSYDCDCVGKGYEEIQVIDKFEKFLEKTDMVAFTDVYNSGKCEWLKSKGYNVYSSMKSELLETDRKLLRRTLEMAKMPLTPAVEMPLGKLQDYLKDKKDKYLKASFYRDDMETEHYEDAYLSAWWFDKMKAKLGNGFDTFKVIVEDPIKSACEAGFEAPMLNGEVGKNPMVGYECKGEAYVGYIPEVLPAPLEKVRKRMAPAYNAYKYQAWYSNEVRITEEGKCYVTDVTCRLGSPPSELYIEQYENFAESVWDLGHGVMPSLKPKKKYGAILVFTSNVSRKYWLPVRFPENIAWAVKLPFSMKNKDGYHLIPMSVESMTGSVLGMGDSVDEAIKQCMEHYEQIECPHKETGGMRSFDEIKETIEAGKKYGIKFA